MRFSKLLFTILACAFAPGWSFLAEVRGGDDPSTPKASIEYIDHLNGRQTAFLGWSEARYSSLLSLKPLGSNPVSSEDRFTVESTCINTLKSPSTISARTLVSDVDGYSWSDVDRFKCINILASLRSKDAVPVLLKIATENVDKDGRERWMATRALGVIGEKRVIPDLIPLLYFPITNVRLYAQISLVRLAGPDAKNCGYDWQAWAQWWSSRDPSYKAPSERLKWALPPNPPDNNPRYLDPDFQIKQDVDFLSSRVQNVVW